MSYSGLGEENAVFVDGLIGGRAEGHKLVGHYPVQVAIL
jgi:hypothetical protein